MDRVWGSNASSSAPTMPANLETGYPRSSGSGTVPGYWWYHMVTESLRAVVVAAGLTPSASDMSQIAQAIQVIAKQSGVSGSLKPVRLLDTVGVALSGTQTVDTIVPTNGARVARSAGLSLSNGIYVVNTSGAWTRSEDFALGATIPDGTLIEINAGSAYANKVFMVNANPSVRDVVVGTDPFELVDITAGITAQLGNYLTTAAAATTYLSQTAASTTYAAKTEISDMLTKTLAASTYLKKTDASNTYATIDALSSYLTTSAASTTYLSKADANTSYLKKTDAAAAYVPLSGTATLDGTYTFTNKTLWQNSKWLYWDAANGTDVRMMGLSSSNVFYVGDIDLAAASSTVYLKANSSIVTNIAGTVRTVVDNGGLRLNASPAAGADDLYVPSTSWVRALISDTVQSGSNSIVLGGYTIKFGIDVTTANPTLTTFPVAFSTSCVCVFTQNIYDTIFYQSSAVRSDFNRYGFYTYNNTSGMSFFWLAIGT